MSADANQNICSSCREEKNWENKKFTVKIANHAKGRVAGGDSGKWSCSLALWFWFSISQLKLRSSRSPMIRFSPLFGSDAEPLWETESGREQTPQPAFSSSSSSVRQPITAWLSLCCGAIRERLTVSSEGRRIVLRSGYRWIAAGADIYIGLGEPLHAGMDPLNPVRLAKRWRTPAIVDGKTKKGRRKFQPKTLKFFIYRFQFWKWKINEKKTQKCWD